MTHCRRRRSSLLALRYSYSINSSALSRIDVGTSRPSALAVFILSAVSYSDRTLRAARRRLQSLKSKGLCRRIHFRRMPSVNDGPSELPDSGLAATSLSAGSPTSRITVRRPRVLLVQPLRARPRPSPQLGVLPLRQPLSSRSWQLRALPPWPLRARPCGRLQRASPDPRHQSLRRPAVDLVSFRAQGSLGYRRCMGTATLC
jgi:hypothetical protein